jgi:hypothetical protein
MLPDLWFFVSHVHLSLQFGSRKVRLRTFDLGVPVQLALGEGFPIGNYLKKG